MTTLRDRMQSPDCPHCGNPPALLLGLGKDVMAFCETDGCPVLTWNPNDTPAQHRRRLSMLDIVSDVLSTERAPEPDSAP